MSNKLYVGNLSFETTANSLTDLFSQSGKVVSATLIQDKTTGKSRGFGFVEFASAEEASKAIESWHGKELNGRPLTVTVARPKVERSRGDAGERGDGEARPQFLNASR